MFSIARRTSRFIYDTYKSSNLFTPQYQPSSNLAKMFVRGGGVSLGLWTAYDMGTKSDFSEHLIVVPFASLVGAGFGAVAYVGAVYILVGKPIVPLLCLSMLTGIYIEDRKEKAMRKKYTL